jgi:hypothetical protein
MFTQGWWARCTTCRRSGGLTVVIDLRGVGYYLDYTSLGERLPKLRRKASKGYSSGEKKH